MRPSGTARRSGDTPEVESYAVHRVLGEFQDPAAEQRFQTHHVESTAHRLTRASIVGSLIMAAFVLSDIVAVGMTARLGVLVAARLLPGVAAIALVVWVRGDATRALNAAWVTVVEATFFAASLVVVVMRPEVASAHDLGMALFITAFFLFVPNRIGWIAGLIIGSSVSYNLIAWIVLDVDVAQHVTRILTLTGFVVVAGVSTVELQRVRRLEFATIMLERRSNSRLSEEISRREVLEGELTWMATHDALTDLLNRGAFYAAANRLAAQARRENHPLSVIVIDADRFKSVNDRFGHHTGDAALQRIAAQCMLHLRTGDVMGRVGGEEFAVVMPGATLWVAQEVAGRLRAAVADNPLEHPLGPISLSVSAGVTQHRVWEESIADTITRADEAMYAAKSGGRNRVVAV